MRTSHTTLEHRYLRYQLYVLETLWTSPKAYSSNLNAASGVDLVKGVN